MSIGLRRAAAIFLFLVLLPSAGRAHDEPYSWVEVRLTPTGWTGRVTAHIDDLAHEIGFTSSDSLQDSERATEHARDLARILDRLLHLEIDGSEVRPMWTGWQFLADRRAIAFDIAGKTEAEPRAVEIQGPLFTYDPAHETYFNVYVEDAVRHQDVLDAGHPRSRWRSDVPQTRAAVVRRFIAEGVHHIFIGPDHILFVVGLLFLGGSVRALLRIVTAFTLAHSVTLALAATGVLSPPARLIESVIALSIVYIGAANLLAKPDRPDRRALVAALFGLVHGFGFANVLRELGLPREALAWSLVSFNVGVEIGQACIVLAVAPLLALLRSRRPRAASGVVQFGSLVVVAAGAYWFVQRAFLA